MGGSTNQFQWHHILKWITSWRKHDSLLFFPHRLCSILYVFIPKLSWVPSGFASDEVLQHSVPCSQKQNLFSSTQASTADVDEETITGRPLKRHMTASCDCCSPSCCAAHATRPPLSTNAAHAGLICACFAHVAGESLPIFKLQIQHHLLYECDISCTVLSYPFQMGMYL